MSLITTAYFTGEINVPDLEPDHPVSTENLAELTRFILIYEKDYLIRLLGSDLYAVFVNGTTAEWKTGLTAQLKDETNLISPIAYWVWVHYKKHITTMSLGTGEATAANENSTVASPVPKIRDMYIKAVNMTYDVLIWINDNISLFPSYPDTDLTAFRPMNDLGI